MIISDIQEREIAELGALYEELSGHPTDMEKLKKGFDLLKQDRNYYLIGAKDGTGKLVGTLMGIICFDLSVDCRPFLVIENVVVEKNSREKGIGKKMVEYIEEVARNHECYYIMLLSAAKRKEAHLFYEKIGYSRELAEGFKKML